MKRASVVWVGILGVCLAVGSVPALGATGYIDALDAIFLGGDPVPKLVLDEDPVTNDTFRFEVVVDSSTGHEFDSYEYLLQVSGLGIEFDYALTEAATLALVTDAAHTPRYLLFEDCLDAWADDDIPDDFTTITVFGLSNGATYDPALRPSLGIFVLRITNAAEAMGMHTITDGGVLIGSEEDLSIGSLVFEVIPEPTTACLLVLGAGALALYRRRR